MFTYKKGFFPLLVLLFLWYPLMADGAYTIKVGETQTLSIDRSVYPNFSSATWTWDKNVLDLVEAKDNNTVLTFRGKKASPSVGVTVQAVITYYTKNVVSGNLVLQKDVRDWQIIVKEDNILIQGITLDPPEVEMNIGNTQLIRPTFYPENATNQEVTWYSNNSTVASVSNTGWITANSAGTATITCYATDGSDQAASCLVTVSPSSTPPPSNGIVVVETLNGERMEYELNTNPRITPSGSVVKLVTDKTTVEFESNKVAKVFIADSPTDVNSLKVAEGNYVLKKDYVRFIGYAPFEPIIIYTVDGRQVSHNITDGDGNLTLPLHNLSSGTFIIKTRHQSIKILRR